MKRLITTLAILLVVIVAGMTALVLLVNPNDFRAWMVKQVEQRSGYQLALQGNLRWHVWPQLSILSGPITLTAQGASQPLVSADNMRLDVDLLPLLSHQLSVNQVMLKGAVVRLTPESKRARPANAPVGPAGSFSPSTVEDVTRGWQFDIAHLKLADSLLIWQQNDGEQLNIRDINLQLDQNQPRQVSLALSSRINRNQRELQLQLSSELDITHYPQQLKAAVTQLDYQLQGVDLPKKGIRGQASLAATWDLLQQHAVFRDIQLSANDNLLSGNISGTFSDDQPHVSADLRADKLDIDTLLTVDDMAISPETQTVKHTVRSPVIAGHSSAANTDTVLNELSGELSLQVGKLRWHGLDMSSVQVQAENQQGLLHINNLQGQMAGGHFSIPATVDVRSANTKITLTPSLQQMDIAPLLKALALPSAVAGKLTLQGEFKGSDLRTDNLMQQWQGSADLQLDNAQFASLNVLQLLQRAVESSSNDRVRGAFEGQPFAQNIKAHATLKQGVITFPSLSAESKMLKYSGSGQIDLLKQQLEMNVGMTAAQGWQGDEALIARLQQTPVPLRLYGPWASLSYSVHVDQALRQQLRDQAKQRLKAWEKRISD